MVRSRSAIFVARLALAWAPLVLLVLLALLPSAVEGRTTRRHETPFRATAVVVTAAAPDSDAVDTPSGHQGSAAEQAPLRTVGGAAPNLTGETEQDLRSQSGSLLAATNSAWNDLSRNERAILLDGQVGWITYEAAVAAAPDRTSLLSPVVEIAEDLDPSLDRGQDLLIHEVVLALPPAELGPALDEGEPQAIEIGPDVVLLVDDVVVAQAGMAADRVAGIEVGEIDDRGLIVLSDSPPATSEAAAESPLVTDTTDKPLRCSASGDPIPRIALEELPIEAIETLILIYQGGPFPFERDGATFGNFEERLPAADIGYYREYTVITPGSDDRGARRIVTGNNDTEFYYTDDHYETFVEVVIAEEEARP